MIILRRAHFSELILELPKIELNDVEESYVKKEMKKSFEYIKKDKASKRRQMRLLRIHGR